MRPCLPARRPLAPGMIREKFRFRETFATILADEERHVAAAKEGMLAARSAIEAYIARDPFFLATFEPYTPDSDDPVILRMAGAARDAGVGPMAAVAGTVAWEGVDAMIDAGAGYAVIDNGGDIALVSDRDVRVGIHAGTATVSDKYAFLVPSTDRVLGICTSSATVGPSISLGMADAVTIFSHDVALSDAWATRICNEIRPDDHSVLGYPDPDKIEGVFAVMGETIVRWGDLPPLVSAVVDEQLISAGDR